MALALEHAKPRAVETSLVRPAIALAAATVVALTLALRLPVATSVLGLALFGILHNILELRYVSGRFASILAGRFFGIVVTLVTGVAVCRTLPPGPVPQAAEILLAYVLIGVSWWWSRSAVPVWGVAVGFTALALATFTSLTFPGFHFVMLSHLHNIVPLFFLWEWSRTFARGRLLFRAVNLFWVLAVPAALLAGALDSALHSTSASLGAFGRFEALRLSAAYTPPPWLDSQFALRFLAVFAFMQTMHYVVWVYILPRYAPDAARSFDARVPWLRGSRAWMLGLLCGGVLMALFLHDWAAGKSVYVAIASYHAYVEFPVLIALLLGLRKETS